MTRLCTLLAATAVLTFVGGPAAAEDNAKTIKGVMTLFEGQEFDRDSYRVLKDNPAIPHDFLVGSIAIYPGDVWEVCDRQKFKGNCLTLSADEPGIGKAVIKSARVIKLAP